MHVLLEKVAHHEIGGAAWIAGSREHRHVGRWTEFAACSAYDYPHARERYGQELCMRILDQAAILTPSSNVTPAITSATSLAPFSSLQRF